MKTPYYIYKNIYNVKNIFLRIVYILSALSALTNFKAYRRHKIQGT